LTPVRADLGVDAFVGKPKALNGPAADQMLFDNFRGVRRLHMAIPNGLRVDHDRGPVFALIEAEGFIDAHG
jgi:hypothetical protein